MIKIQDLDRRVLDFQNLHPDNLVVPLVWKEQELSLEDSIKLVYSRLGIDFSRETSFFDVFNIKNIASLLEGMGYSFNPSQDERRRIRNILEEWSFTKNFSRLFTRLFCHEISLSYVYFTRNERGYERINSSFFHNVARTSQDIGQELNRNRKGSAMLFIERAIALTTMTHMKKYSTKVMPYSKYYSTMAQLYSEQGLTMIEEGLGMTGIKKSLENAERSISYALNDYRNTMFEIFKRKLLDIKSKNKDSLMPIEIVDTIDELVWMIDARKQAAATQDDMDLYGEMWEHILYLKKKKGRQEDKVYYDIKYIVKKYEAVGDALYRKQFFQPLEDTLNFCLRRLVILIDRCVRHRQISREEFESCISMFEEDFGRMARLGAKLKYNGGENWQRYAEIGTFRGLYTMFGGNEPWAQKS